MKTNSPMKFLLATVLLLAGAHAAQAQMSYADFSTWVKGSTANQTLNFPNHGTVTVSGITNSTSGWPEYYSETYNNLLAPVTGAVPELLLSAAAGSTGTIRFDFSDPLTSSSYMVIDDVDFVERMTFKAYDASNNLLNLSNWSFSVYDIKLPVSGVAPTFSLIGTTEGALVGDSTQGTTQWAAFFQPAAGQNVSRIDATYSNSAFFEFAFASPVPEPSGALLLGIVGMMVLLRRRRSLTA